MLAACLQTEKEIQSGGEIRELQTAVDRLKLDLAKAKTDVKNKKENLEAEEKALKQLQAAVKEVTQGDAVGKLQAAEKARDEARAAVEAAEVALEAASRELAGERLVQDRQGGAGEWEAGLGSASGQPGPSPGADEGMFCGTVSQSKLESMPIAREGREALLPCLLVCSWCEFCARRSDIVPCGGLRTGVEAGDGRDGSNRSMQVSQRCWPCSSLNTVYCEASDASAACMLSKPAYTPFAPTHHVPCNLACELCRSVWLMLKTPRPPQQLRPRQLR